MVYNLGQPGQRITLVDLSQNKEIKFQDLEVGDLFYKQVQDLIDVTTEEFELQQNSIFQKINDNIDDSVMVITTPSFRLEALDLSNTEEHIIKHMYNNQEISVLDIISPIIKGDYDGIYVDEFNMHWRVQKEVSDE